MKLFAIAAAVTWAGLWFTPDQQGWRLLKRGEPAVAAKVFRDPLWQGVAWYRAGEFENAARSFARRDTADAYFNQGNAWLMRGKYEAAVAAYDRALAKRPDWMEARENRDLALGRAALVEQQGGEMGKQKLGADEIAFDKGKHEGGQETDVPGEQGTSDAAIQALWLRRMQTKPADFLRAKFAYQHAAEEGGQ